MIGGAVSGILEGVFEKISLGQLEAMKALPTDTVKNILGNIAKSVATNAGEEFSTELANTIFDTIFMGELSTYELSIKGYMSQGKSEADAKKLANGDLFARLCESAASGALMGVLFGGGASASSYYRSQLAARGEAKLRAKDMPTPRELEALNAREAEARGAMVLLNLDQFDGGKNSVEANDLDLIDSVAEAINGARITEPESSAAEAHANRYYGLVRSMTTDVTRISQNTGYSEDVIRRIKNFIFMDKHDLGGTEPCRFDPSFAMAQSWQRLIAGTPEPHDLTMLKHEIFESELMDAGMSQYDAHIEASKKYNYTKESDNYYGSFGQR